jgi:tRNA modification GTPase
MSVSDTIVARASAPGPARRAVIRISGPLTAAVLDALDIDTPPRRAASSTRATIHTRQDLPLLVLRFVAPASYTGQDAAELLVPANPHLVEMILDRASAIEGVRRAEPGEFTARAYLAGRLTLAQAEGVAAKIAADNTKSLRAADRVLSGQAGLEHRAWADRLATLLARVEAGIDFTDQEDVVAVTSCELRDALEELQREVTAAIGSAHRAWTTERPLVALVGPPNAGKSTLFNALLGRTRVVESPTAGTTRDVIIETLDLSAYGTGSVDLADLPGLEKSASDAISQAAQTNTRNTLEHADLIVLCDPQARFEQVETSTPTIRVQTQADEHLPGEGCDLSICSLDGWHLGTLVRMIAAHAFGSRRADDSDLIPRHRAHAKAATDHLGMALETLTDQPETDLLDAELIAGSLRGALDHLGSITGQIPPDEIIGRIFASFCIGK